jgi:hypothetical protein
VAYLVFQLYSHPHLYEDSVAGTRSRRFSIKQLNRTPKELGSTKTEDNKKTEDIKQTQDNDSTHGRSTSVTVLDSSSQRLSPSGTLVSQNSLKKENSLTDVAAHDTVKLVENEGCVWDNVPYLYETSTEDSDPSLQTSSGVRFDNKKEPGVEEQDTSDNKKIMEPKLSWFMTILLLGVVTVVSSCALSLTASNIMGK